jgi:hypothetical protein
MLLSLRLASDNFAVGRKWDKIKGAEVVIQIKQGEEK